ncbi:MAG: cache domain-containing protein [Desulfopila sp.]|jgi:PAS domain S-box-containing protein|nr:cache domain-containing protein [Desulfopila sp.]
MPRFSQLSLASSPLYVSLFVIGTLCLFISSFWAYNEYQAYQDTVANIRLNYQQQYRMRVKEENEKIVDFVEYKRWQQEVSIETEIRDKVQSAYSIASHVYSLYKEEKSMADLRHMVVELLRPVRWDNGLGYYFAGNISNGVIELLADNPELEGVHFDALEDDNIKDVITLITEIVAKRGAGMVRYNLTKPESLGSFYPKISFVKLFSPFNWFIGAGVYGDEIERRIQEDILERIQRLGFGMDGEVLIFRLDGAILCSTDKRLLGRSVLSIKDVTASLPGGADSYGRKLLSLAASAEKNGFFEYSSSVDGTAKRSERLAYVNAYPDWGWGIVTSISMLEMEKLIGHETSMYQNIAFKNTWLFLVLCSTAIVILLLISYFYSLKIKKGIDHFTGFFRKAADSKARVEIDQLSFREFVLLGEYANQMNADRLAQEKVIRRDEKRLDTLLQLSLMESYSVREIFDFTLKRIAEITESKGAYLVTIEEEEVRLRSQVVLTDQELCCSNVSRAGSAKNDASLTRVIQNCRIDIGRDIEESPQHTYFSITEKIVHRLDVPVMENGIVVAVLGLCNKNDGYTEDDTRQVMLLLEGMWLHINKVENRKEMLRLRLLLKDITDSMPSVLIGIDRNFTIMQWNRLAEKYSGVTGEEAQGRSLQEILPEMQKHEKAIQKVIHLGEETEIRKIPVTVNGESRYESITIYPLKYNEMHGAVIRIDDITDLVGMEEMMIQSEKMLSVGGLAAGIAHEINNPLASVSQNLQVIKKRFAQEMPQNRITAERLGISLDDIHCYLRERGIDVMLDIIGADSTRAVKLVRNMLSFSRKSASIFEEYDLRILLDNALQLVLADSELKKSVVRQIVVIKEYEENVGPVCCEGTNIQQVFFNIIQNAVFAITENKDKVEKPRLILRLAAKDRMVKVEIEDNGMGMDRGTAKNIFEPFFTTKGAGKGTGLGLSISYYIVAEQHKGSLLVQSEQGKGAVFTLLLPVEQIVR